MSVTRFIKIADFAPGGHRIFFDKETDQLAVADQSGSAPDVTEDGILYIDFSVKLDDRAGRMYVPVITPKDEMYKIIVTGPDRDFYRGLFAGNGWEVSTEWSKR